MANHTAADIPSYLIAMSTPIIKIVQSEHIPLRGVLSCDEGDIDKKNERQETDIETAIGFICVVQITGAIANVVFAVELTPDQQTTTGERVWVDSFWFSYLMCIYLLIRLD